jgi:DNA replication protein DnaC
MSTDTMAIVARLEATFRTATQARQEFVTTLPASSPCPRHPEIQRPRDGRRSWLERRVMFGPCPVCEQALRQRLENERLLRMGVPDILCHATLENWPAADEQAAANLAAVQEFAQVRRGFLVLLGDVGRGKTHLAVGVLRTFKSGWLVTQSDLLRRLRATYRDREAENPVQAAQDAGCLVLDEMGHSTGGADELNLLHDVLDYRHGHRKPTILTGNVGYDQICSVIGGRMADRLRESAFAVLSFGGSSARPMVRERYFG